MMKNQMNIAAGKIDPSLLVAFSRTYLPISNPPKLGTYIGIIGANLDELAPPLLGKIYDQKHFGCGAELSVGENGLEDCQRYAEQLMRALPGHYRLFTAQFSPAADENPAALLADIISWMESMRVQFISVHERIWQLLTQDGTSRNLHKQPTYDTQFFNHRTRQDWHRSDYPAWQVARLATLGGWC